MPRATPGTSAYRIIICRYFQDPYAENFDEEMMDFPKRMPKKQREPKEKKPK